VELVSSSSRKGAAGRRCTRTAAALAFRRHMMQSKRRMYSHIGCPCDWETARHSRCAELRAPCMCGRVTALCSSAGATLYDLEYELDSTRGRKRVINTVTIYGSRWAYE
jgi:hypothetical protein